MRKIISFKLLFVSVFLSFIAAPMSFADSDDEARAIALCNKSVELQNQKLIAGGQKPIVDSTFAANSICPHTQKTTAHWQCVVSRQESGESSNHAEANCKDN